MSGHTKTFFYDGPKTLKNAGAEDIIAVPEGKRDFSLMHCTDTLVSVNGCDCYVYDTNVNHSREWEYSYAPAISRTPITYFDFEGMAEIKIKVINKNLESVMVSPLSYGIEPEIDKVNSTITFQITKPDTYTVMLNDSPERAIHIFANPLEEDIPDFQEDNVLYFGPGEWDIGEITANSGQCIYIAGGAVVHGSITADGADHVTVRGRGIIDGSKYECWSGIQEKARVPLRFDNCKNVVVKDVIVLNPNAWVCQGYATKNMAIDRIKIVSCRPNGDGITLQSCTNVEVKNCFVRSWDDSLVIKNYSGNTEHIYFSDIQLWTDFAQSMEIGYETNKGCEKDSVITDICFADICVLQNYHKPIVSIHNADEAMVSGIIFKNITVEHNEVGSGDADEMPYLIDFNIARSVNWSTTKERGITSNVTIENMQVLSGRFCRSRICGFDEEHKVSNITISNLEILGEKVTSPEVGKFEIDERTTANIMFK